jgi:hypothetical protein
MSFEIHFLIRTWIFPENLGAEREEQGERFHQDMKEMERKYQGWWNVNMIGDYCWTLHLEIPKPHIRERVTYANSLARERGSKSHSIKFNL